MSHYEELIFALAGGKLVVNNSYYVGGADIHDISLSVVGEYAP